MVIRPTKRAILPGVGLLLLLATGTFVLLNESDGSPEVSRHQGKLATTGLLPGKLDERRNKPARSEREINRLAEQWYQQILAKHPELAVSFKDVPDAQNGFLKFLEFTERHGKYGSDGLPMPEEISAMVSGKSPWDAAIMAKWLEENRGLIDEIMAIGLLPLQSAKGIEMERIKFFSARLPNECSKLLLAQAHLAMERGDEAGALQSTRAALGLADHMDRMELPSLLSETVSILIRQNTRKAILDHLLASEGGPASDLQAWQDLLAGNPETPADLARVFLGEWNHTARSFLLPALLGDPTNLPGVKTGISDPDAVVEAHIRYFTGLMSQMRSSDLGGLAALSAVPPDKTGISEDGASLLDILFVGSSAWSKGWTRAQTDAAIAQAAFLAAAGGEIPNEPYTGKPFVIDREAGTVSVPRDPWFESMNYPPMKIPALKQR
ncbi:hypothetical protein [Haloferula sp. BvORR071]|uniref:hypothetical protein n=1 Tax=Haloferula sp. BvORR071 TaxID=1396141 RepID=UPI0005505418|nr:hypothetical protein [Haloferula sp. BvORR071]